MKKFFQIFSTIFKDNVLLYLSLNILVLFFHLLIILKSESWKISESISILFIFLVILAQLILMIKWRLFKMECQLKISLFLVFSLTSHFFNEFYLNNENKQNLKVEIFLMMFISVSLMKNVVLRASLILFITFFLFFKLNFFRFEMILQIIMYSFISLIMITKTLFFLESTEENTKDIKKKISFKQTQSLREVKTNSQLKESKPPIEIMKENSCKESNFLKDSLKEKTTDKQTKFYYNILFKTSEEGIIVFDNFYNIKWRNEHVNTIFNLSEELPVGDIELSERILNIKQDEMYLKMQNNLVKSKVVYESLVNAFQTRLVTFRSNDYSNDFNSMTSTPKKKRFTSKPSHRTRTFNSNKFSKRNDLSSDKFVYFLNRNNGYKLSNKKSIILRDLKDYLQDIFEGNHSKKMLHSKSLENFHKFNFYGSYFEENEYSKLLSIRLFPYSEEEIVVMFKTLEEKDLMQISIKESANQNKLLASMCHELRTPLNFLTNILELMQNDCKEKEKENYHDDYIDNALVNSKLLVNSVNDFLDYFSISSNLFNLEEGHFIFEQLILDSFNLFLFMAKLKNIEYILEYDENLPLICYNDEKRIKQIILNLLNNAFKFTISGSIILKAKKLENSNYIEISIKDTGIGIPEKNLTKLAIFSTESSSQQTGGFGLCISNILANYVGPYNLLSEESSHYYKGLKLKTEIGKGSKFSFLIYIADSTNTVAERENKTNKTSTKTNQVTQRSFDMSQIEDFNEIHCSNFNFINFIQNNTKENKIDDKELPSEIKNNKELRKNCACFQLLLVDDNEFNLFVVKEKFKKYGISIDIAKSGIEAIEKISKILFRNEISIFCQNCKFYKLVLMDIDMPVKNGYETTIELNELFHQYNIKIPIIAVSAFSQIQYKEKAKKVGMTDYIEKPLTHDKFLFILKKFIEGH